MEIVGLRNMTMQDLARHAAEMGVTDAIIAPAPAAPNPGSASTVEHDMDARDDADVEDAKEDAALPGAAPVLPTVNAE